MGLREWFGFGDQFAAIGLPATASAAEVAARCEALRIEAQRDFMAGNAVARRTLATVEAARSALSDDAACQQHVAAIEAGRRRRVRVLAFGVFPGAVAIALAPLIQSIGPAVPAPLDTDSDAYFACESFVRGRLKAPSTAQFGGYSVAQVSRVSGTQTFGVIGSVDAQNAFGAMLRKPWSCEVELRGDRWHLLHIALD